MKAILHIGPHKTGTSTIQEFLGVNREKLKENGLYVPMHRSYFGESAKSWGIYCMACDRERWQSHPLFDFWGNIVFYCSDPASASFSREQYRQSWEAAMKTIQSEIGDAGTVVFSSEELSLLSMEEILYLKETLCEYFDEFTVVAYLRRQPEILVSMYTQHVRNYSTSITFEQLCDLRGEDVSWDYEVLLLKWAGVFGQENVITRVFDRKVFLKQELTTDFLNAIGYEANDYVNVPDTNLSLSAAAVEFAAIFNNKEAAATLSDLPFQPKEVDLLLEEYTTFNKDKRTGYLLNRPRAESILERFRESNNSVARKYFSRETLFDEDCSRYPEETAHHDLTLEKSVDIARFLWMRQQERLASLQECNAAVLHQFEGTRNHCNELENTLQEKNALLEEYGRTLMEKGALLEEYEQAMAADRAQLQELRQAMASKEQEAGTMRHELVRKNHLLEESSQASRQKDDRIQAMEQLIAACNERLGRQRQLSDRQNECLRELIAVFEDKEAAIREARTAISENEQSLRHMILQSISAFRGDTGRLQDFSDENNPWVLAQRLVRERKKTRRLHDPSHEKTGVEIAESFLDEFVRMQQQLDEYYEPRTETNEHGETIIFRLPERGIHKIAG